MIPNFVELLELMYVCFVWEFLDCLLALTLKFSLFAEIPFILSFYKHFMSLLK